MGRILRQAEHERQSGNLLVGDARTMSDSAQGGDDTLTGGDCTGSGRVLNQLFGDASQMSGSAQGGDDELTGGDSSSVDSR